MWVKFDEVEQSTANPAVLVDVASASGCLLLVSRMRIQYQFELKSWLKF